MPRQLSCRVMCKFMAWLNNQNPNQKNNFDKISIMRSCNLRQWKRCINHLCSNHRWFQELCHHYGVRGRTYFLYKPHGQNSTRGITERQALGKLKTGLRGQDMAYIYHCQNHYFCPIGYEDVPLVAEHAYRSVLGAGPIFCLLLEVSSGCAWPITGQVTSVTWPVIGWA